MNKGFVATEEAMPASKQITFEPSLALMLTQYFHHASVRREVVIFRKNLVPRSIAW